MQFKTIPLCFPWALLATSILFQGAHCLEEKPSKQEVVTQKLNQRADGKALQARLLHETQADDLFQSAAWETAELDFKKAASRIVGTNFLLYDPMLDSKFRNQVLGGGKEPSLDTFAVGEAPPALSNHRDEPSSQQHNLDVEHHLLLQAPLIPSDDIHPPDITLPRPPNKPFHFGGSKIINQFSGSAMNVDKPPAFSQESQPAAPVDVAPDYYQEYASYDDNAGSAHQGAHQSQSYYDNYDVGRFKGPVQNNPDQLNIRPHGVDHHEDYHQQGANDEGGNIYDNYEDGEQPSQGVGEGHINSSGHEGAVTGDVDGDLPLIQEPPVDEMLKKKKKKNKRKNKKKNGNKHINDFSQQGAGSAASDGGNNYNDDNDSKNGSNAGDYINVEDYFKPSEAAAASPQQNNDSKDFTYPTGETQQFTSAEFNNDPDFNDAEDNYSYDEERPSRPATSDEVIREEPGNIDADVLTVDFEDEPHSGPHQNGNPHGFRQNRFRQGNWNPLHASSHANPRPAGGRRPFRDPQQQEKDYNFDFPTDVNDGPNRKPPAYDDVYDAAVEDAVDGGGNNNNDDVSNTNEGNQQQAEDYDGNLDFVDDSADGGNNDDDLKHEDFKDIEQDDDNDAGRTTSSDGNRGNSAGGFLAGLTRPLFRFRQQSQKNSDEDEDLDGVNGDVFADRYDDPPLFFSRY